jgi:peptidoglycan hydrolase-like protein with peptidoglycan-binding domain
MRMILGATAALAILWLSVATAQQSQKKTAPAAKRTGAATKKGTTTSKKGATTANRKAAPKRPATTWRNRQLAPSADRYREIQAALAARGYLPSEGATGVWNQESSDALRRFQTEQNIESSGKINSLSLIALGLGPKRDPSPVVPPKPQLDQGPQR